MAGRAYGVVQVRVLDAVHLPEHGGVCLLMLIGSSNPTCTTTFVPCVPEDVSAIRSNLLEMRDTTGRWQSWS